jgi:uncharacterized protein (TIGR02466 family)
MEIQHVFTTPVIVDYLNIDNKSLENFCRKTIAVADSRLHPNQSGSLDLTTAELQPLIDEIQIRLDKLHTELGFKSGTKFKIIKAWANINNSKLIDLPHCHPTSVFSAVYYVKGSGTPENGNIVLLSPLDTLIQYAIPDKNKEFENIFNSWHCTIPPETGKLVIFPSWIMHTVSTNKLPQSDRISIAFDAIIG